MGLLYPLPISTDENDFVITEESKITLKSYGLPYIFWLYALAAFAVYIGMMLGVWSTMQALINSPDSINQVLALSFLIFTISLPITILGFFFYQKIIIADYGQRRLSIKHKIFGLPIKTQGLGFGDQLELDIIHYLDSPNMARIQRSSETRGFQNKGYYILEAKNPSQRIIIDRSSSKTDLKKIKVLLESINVKPES